MSRREGRDDAIGSKETALFIYWTSRSIAQIGRDPAAGSQMLSQFPNKLR